MIDALNALDLPSHGGLIRNMKPIDCGAYDLNTEITIEKALFLAEKHEV